MPDSPTFDTDVLVIGGGPAGSTAATLLARQGWRVTLLEKGRHPRFHIGESLLPMNLPILERLGVLTQVRAIGVRKLAADFPGADGDYSSFSFGRALTPASDHAFQVRRAEFDQILFRQAGNAGADIREQCEVLELLRCDAGRQIARVRSPTAEFELSSRYVVDASGRDTLLGRRFGLKRANPRHRSAALYAHFRGVARRPGDQAGNISVFRLPRGWMWMIPLPDALMSVGAVCDPEYLKSRRASLDQFLLDTVNSNPEARLRMRGASAVSAAEATGNYSYACGQIAGPGWVMAGDAYTFVDPIFSSGVYLAMAGAEQAAAVVDRALRQPQQEQAAQRAYAKRMDAGIAVFSWFIERFTTPVMAQLFRRPRNVWQIEQAVISMLAGDVFDNRPALRRLRAFRLIYRLTAFAQRLRRGPRAAIAAGAA